MRFIFLLTLASLLFTSCTKNDDTPNPPTDPVIPAPGLDTLTAGWQMKRIDTTGTYLLDIVFTNASYGFTCGDKKALYKTTDGGSTWQSVFTPLGSYYTNIQFLNSQYGFIASNGGGTGGIMRTSDGGNNWQIAQLPTNGSPIDVFFLNPVTGFCTSQGGLMKSVDSGKTWISVSPIYKNLSALWFLNSTKGFISSKDSGLLKTLDGGATLSTIINVRSDSYLPVYFANATNGCAGLGRNLYVTNDGGNNWSLLKQFSTPISDVKNTGPNEYYVITSGEVWHTTDGGANWVRELKIVSADLVELTLSQPGHVWIAGSNGRLYYK